MYWFCQWLVPEGLWRKYSWRIEKLDTTGGKVIAIDNALKTFEGKEGFDLKKHSETENEGTHREI